MLPPPPHPHPHFLAPSYAIASHVRKKLKTTQANFQQGNQNYKTIKQVLKQLPRNQHGTYLPKSISPCQPCRLATTKRRNSTQPQPLPVRERNVLFNDALDTFYLRLYGVRHMVKDHSDSEKGNPLPPHRLLLSINSKGSFICTIPQTG